VIQSPVRPIPLLYFIRVHAMLCIVIELRAKYDRGEEVSAGPQQPGQQQQHHQGGHPFFQQGGQQFHFRFN
jgi:hypothetical protein